MQRPYHLARITTEQKVRHGLQIRASYCELDEVKSAPATASSTKSNPRQRGRCAIVPLCRCAITTALFILQNIHQFHTQSFDYLIAYGSNSNY
jgi:hypothetical protein